MPIGWWSRRRGPGRLDEHVERINEIANGLVAVSLAMQAEEAETARRTADETLWQASRLLSQAVAQAEARARRRRTVSRVASATVAVAAAAAIAVSLPDVGPRVDPDRLAGDEVQVVSQLDASLGRAPAASLRGRQAASPPELVSTEPAERQRERRAVPSAPQLSVEAPPDDGATVTAAASSDPVRDAPAPTGTVGSGETSGETGDDGTVEPEETHPGVLASGRAQPAGRARVGGVPGPPGHANAGGVGAVAAAWRASDA